MKDFTPIKIPQSERLEVNSREGKLLNKAFWAAIALLVKQINSMMERLLANINPNFPLWGRCEEITIRQEQGGAGTTVEVAVRHNLGCIPSRWIVTENRFTDNTRSSVNAWAIMRAGTAWTSTRVFFILPTYEAAMEYKILLLP